jgi:hypothetical protein
MLVAVGAVVAALLAGGSWNGFNNLKVHWPWLVVAAILAQAIGAELAAHGSHGWFVAGLALSAALALAFCLVNLRLAGLALIALGLALNALVVGLNSAMPVSIFSASRANVSIVTISVGGDPRHTIAGIGTTWRALGDTIPVPLPIAPEVVSPGDVLVAAGIGELVFVTMRRSRRSRRKGRDQGSRSAQNHAPKPAVVTLFD